MRRPAFTSPQMGLTGGRHQRGSSVFGVPLDNNETLPPVLLTLCKYIRKYNVREADLTQSNAAAAQQLRLLLQQCPTAQIDNTLATLPAVLSVLQCFFMELPEPLLPEHSTTKLLKCGLEESDASDMSLVLEELPAANLRVVEYLSSELSRLCLSAAQLGAMFAPSLFRLKDKADQQRANNVLATIIQRKKFLIDNDEDVTASEDVKEKILEDSGHCGRKRKERENSQQSALDKKMIRSSSEERPGAPNSQLLRRASSHGDMLADSMKTNCDHAEGEQEEELRTPKENVCPNREEEPAVDLSKLAEDEPVLSWQQVYADGDERVTLSPRASFFLEHAESAWSRDLPSPPVAQQDRMSPRAGTIRKLHKKIRSLKAKLREKQEKFEQEHGYKPSQTDRITDPVMREITSNLTRLRKQLKQLKDLDITHSLSPAAAVLSVRDEAENQSEAALHETFLTVQKMMSDSRSSDGRGQMLEEFTHEQVLQEKQALQRALLMWEGIHGRPNNVIARSMISSYYERYRLVKRMLSRSGSPTDLQPIHEHEEIVNWQQPGASAQQNVDQQRRLELPHTKNYHEMSISELRAEFRYCQEKKKDLGRKIREWEDQFEESNGRKAQKADRWPLLETYSAYKQTKHNMRLVEALVSKSVSK